MKNAKNINQIFKAPRTNMLKDLSKELLLEMLRLKKNQREKMKVQAKAEAYTDFERCALHECCSLADDLSALVVKNADSDLSAMVEAMALLGAVIVGLSDGTGMEPTERLIDVKRAVKDFVSPIKEKVH